MDKNYLIQLTNNLYRMTLFFPKKEPLRYKMREIAANFLAGPNKDDLDTLDGFFEISLAQNWVSPSDVLAMREDYAKLRPVLENEEMVPQQTLPQVVREMPELGSFQYQSGMTQRQEKIMAFLKDNGKAQVWQVKEILPEVTKRTLRRDFESLLHSGKIERVGEKNNTFYQLKSYTA